MPKQSLLAMPQKRGGLLGAMAIMYLPGYKTCVCGLLMTEAPHGPKSALLEM
jgi:hypothetical protein